MYENQKDDDDDMVPFVVMGNGVRLHLLRPVVTACMVEGIAHRLNRMMRFAGQCDRHNSVLVHSFSVAILAEWREPGAWRLGLLHDAHEAFTGDIIGPMKASIRKLSPSSYAAIEVIENRIDLAIFKACGLPDECLSSSFRNAVKRADYECLAHEWDYYVGSCERASELWPDVNPRKAARADEKARDLFRRRGDGILALWTSLVVGERDWGDFASLEGLEDTMMSMTSYLVSYKNKRTGRRVSYPVFAETEEVARDVSREHLENDQGEMEPSDWEVAFVCLDGGK